MIERRNLRTRIDRYLRKKDTVLANSLHAVCSDEGQRYRESSKKRVREAIIISPVAVVTLLLLGVLALMAKLEDGGSSFYVHERIGKNRKPIPLVKIRRMKEEADKESWAIIHERNQIVGEAGDPRNTKLGRFMRQYELEELPQLWQVILGTIALVDIRAVTQDAADLMKKLMGESAYNKWENAYLEGRPGLFSLNSAINNHRKNDTQRSPLDLLYAEKASMGLDLFVLYRTGLRMAEKLYMKVAS